MKPSYATVVCAVALVGLTSPARAAIQLIPVVTSGITSPTFVGHAGDGSDRLFILEQAGLVDVLQPGDSTPSMFLDIRDKVKSGGEQGLLGLAFHPDYATNGRFFVFYTRMGDGTLVIAEYKVSSTNTNLADPTETIILTIPHPTNTNHNGGMLAFGQDGYLYIGVGDGGAANDPPNNAQNKNVLLGKILRIDVNVPPGPGPRYVSPSDNPFFGPIDGADEIFALGMRNPWRFSFDRITGQQWVADVGQGSREEVDTPILNGGNYGWRVYEGTACTNTDPTLCNPNNYIFPVFDYIHANSRCSITGGYVYEGSLNPFPTGTYVYGDYCSGELFSWDGNTQSVVLDTALRISSFGEDEQGELYVVDLAGGSISRIASTVQCTYAIAPTRTSFPVLGGTDTVTVAAPAGCAWTAASNATWITITGGASGNGNGQVTYSVAPYTGKPRNRNGTMTIAEQTFSIKQSR